MDEYDQIFDWYLNARNNETGVNSVKLAFKDLNRGSTVVDLGCGTGIPLALKLNEMGIHVIGVDSSKLMVEAFKKNFPNNEVMHSSIQSFEFPKKHVDAVLCWGCLFHLTPNDQITVLNKIFNSVKSGGRYLFTSAKENDNKTGEMNGIKFKYYSLGSVKYNELANNAGWKQIHESEDEGNNYEYLFERM